MSCRWLCLLIALFPVSSMFPLTAQQRAMTIVDLINMPGLGDPQISPDGSQLLFVQTDPDWDENSTISHI